MTGARKIHGENDNIYEAQKNHSALILLINNSAQSAENFRSTNCKPISAHVRGVTDN